MSGWQLKLVGIVGLAVSFAAASSGAATSTCDQAARVIDSYYQSLQTGDVVALRELFRGRLAQRRTELLNNPNYSGHLIERFQRVEHQILNCVHAQPDRIQIDVLEALNVDESIQKRFYLQYLDEGSISGITNILLSLADN